MSTTTRHVKGTATAGLVAKYIHHIAQQSQRTPYAKITYTCCFPSFGRHHHQRLVGGVAH